MRLPVLARLGHILPAIAVVAIAVPASGQDPAAPAGGRPATRAVLGTQPQQFLLTKITVADLQRSEDFYTRLIGLRRAMPVGVPPPAAMLKPAAPKARQRTRREIMLNFSGTLADPVVVLIGEPGVAPTPEAARLTWVGFKVPDVSAAVQRVKQAGFEIVRDGAAVSPQGVRVALVRDPDGYIVELIQTPAN